MFLLNIFLLQQIWYVTVLEGFFIVFRFSSQIYEFNFSENNFHNIISIQSLWHRGLTRWMVLEANHVVLTRVIPTTEVNINPEVKPHYIMS